jgi:hypothetical protein
MATVRRAAFVGLLGLCMLLAVGVRAQSRPQGDALGADERDFVIDAVLAKLASLYVDEQTARNMETAVRARQTGGRYDSVTSGVEFARVLTEDLRSVSGDRHLVVDFVADPSATTVASVPLGPTSAQPRSTEQITPGWPRDSRGCLFVNVATLGGNVGYVKFDEFRPPAACADAAAAAMRLIADCDALIFDLRDNSGGDPAMVAFMASYLFGKPTHLTDIYERRTNVTYESWTVPFVPGPRFLDRPVFILISPRTFSAAEEFAYDLQMLGRAVVVGETSRGGAHPAESFAINARFTISVPVGRYINPASRTNWESRGVMPDFRATEKVAVQTAYREALRQITGTMQSATLRNAAQRQIDALTAIIEAERLR